MAVLTQQELQKIAASSGYTGAPITSVGLPTAQAPTTASAVNPLPEVKMPEVKTDTQGTSGISGMVEYYKNLFDTYDQQQKDLQAERDAAVSKQTTETKGFLDKILSSKSPTTARSEAEAATGVSAKEYFAEQRAQIAEIGKLNEEYANYVKERDQQIANLEGQGRGIPIDFLNNQRAQIERNAAPRLNALSSRINSKAAIVEASQGRFQEAQKYIDTAVQDATADLKFTYDQFKTFWDLNQDAIDKLDERYKEAIKGGLSAAEDAYKAADVETREKGNLIVEAAKYGVDLSRMLSGSLEDLQKAYSAQVAPRALLSKTGTELTPTQNSTLLSITNKFQAEPVIKNMDRAAGLRSIANQVLSNPALASNQLKSLYTFIKALDPDSAVREGEISLSEKAQSYVSLAGNVMTRLSKGLVIAPEVAREFANAVLELSDAWQASAQSTIQRYQAQAGTFGLDSYFNDFVTQSGIVANDPQYSEGDEIYIDGKIHVVGEDGQAYALNELFTPLSK